VKTFRSAVPPYTEGLLSGHPSVDKDRDTLVIPGVVPRLINPPGDADSILDARNVSIPVITSSLLFEVGPGHEVARHLYARGKVEKNETCH
jgi:hypothetical protein